MLAPATVLTASTYFLSPGGTGKSVYPRVGGRTSGGLRSGRPTTLFRFFSEELIVVLQGIQTHNEMQPRESLTLDDARDFSRLMALLRSLPKTT